MSTNQNLGGIKAIWDRISKLMNGNDVTNVTFDEIQRFIRSYNVEMLSIGKKDSIIPYPNSICDISGDNTDDFAKVMNTLEKYRIEKRNMGVKASVKYHNPITGRDTLYNLVMNRNDPKVDLFHTKELNPNVPAGTYTGTTFKADNTQILDTYQKNGAKMVKMDGTEAE